MLVLRIKQYTVLSYVVWIARAVLRLKPVFWGNLSQVKSFNQGLSLNTNNYSLNIESRVSCHIQHKYRAGQTELWNYEIN